MAPDMKVDLSHIAQVGVIDPHSDENIRYILQLYLHCEFENLLYDFSQTPHLDAVFKYMKVWSWV